MHDVVGPGRPVPFLLATDQSPMALSARATLQ